MHSSRAVWIFLSTPSARRATYHEWYGRIKDAISIHALREEGDGQHSGAKCYHDISIHALREEGDFFVPNRLLWEH